MIDSKPKTYQVFLYPLTFVALLWIVKLFEIIGNVNLSTYGLYPRTLPGLLGIITEPLLHADIPHLLANSIPLLILGTIIIYFYRPIAFQLFFWVYFSTGIWVWAAARGGAYHIGASGIIYGFESFLFFSGIFRKNTRLMALSLLIVFLYGSAVWGIFPIEKNMSWESHALGALAGLITAYNFRKEGPPDQTYDFGDDAENEKLTLSEDDVTAESRDTLHNDITINYEYIEKKKGKEAE